MTNYLVSCTKCNFEIDCDDTSLVNVMAIWAKWNEDNHESMNCVHDYKYEEVK